MGLFEFFFHFEKLILIARSGRVTTAVQITTFLAKISSLKFLNNFSSSLSYNVKSPIMTTMVELSLGEADVGIYSKVW